MSTMSARGKGKIRPPRRGLTSPGETVDFESIWAELASSLLQIHTKDASKLSFEELYRSAYKLVLKKKGDLLYTRVLQFEESWLSETVQARIRDLVAGGNLVSVTTVGIGGMTANERRVAGEKYMKGLKEAWENHILCMSMTTDVLMYLDRVYCADNRKPSIFTASMGLFREIILRSPLLTDRSDPTSAGSILNAVILDQIQMDREGDAIEKTLIRACVYMLEGLYETLQEDESEKLYLTSFEAEFLSASHAFYRSEGETLLKISDASNYLRHTSSRLKEEQDRCRSTISPLTAPKIKQVVEEELVRRNIKEVLELEGSGLNFMLDNDRLEDLALAYDLVGRIDSTKMVLQNAMQKRIVQLGLQINKTAELAATMPPKPAEKEHGEEGAAATEKTPVLNAAAQHTAAAIKWVDDVLSLNSRYDYIWEHALQSDTKLQAAITRSFHQFINEFPRCSEYVSLFIDDNFKRGLKGKTEMEADAVLEKAITLVRFIQDKDMFERYYMKHLSRRLLMGKSVNQDAEKQIISRMKMEVGTQFTRSMEGMFKDMPLSEELTAAYKTHVKQLESDSKVPELSMHVLTTLHWPVESLGSSASATSTDDGQAKHKCIYPPEIEKIRAGFEKFYLSKHSGRKLTWLPNLGTADIRAVFPKVEGRGGALGKERKHDINVSTYAMLILLLFNDLEPDQSYTFEELQTQTNIPTNDLIRNLQSLAVAPKTRILRKEPMSKDVKPTDRFFFNDSFSSKFLKLKVGVVAGGTKAEGEKERKDTEKKNDQSRGTIIEACVMRIMKQRKELPHQQLLRETIPMVSAKFNPHIDMIKRRIESLIEREYLERIEGAAKPAYRYLA